MLWLLEKLKHIKIFITIKSWENYCCLNLASFTGEAVTQIGCPPSQLVFHNSHTGGRQDLGGHWGPLGGPSYWHGRSILVQLLPFPHLTSPFDTTHLCYCEAHWQFGKLMWQFNDVAGVAMQPKGQMVKPPTKQLKCQCNASLWFATL